MKLRVQMSDKTIALFFTFLSLLPLSLYSQNKISGVVLDSETGVPIANVNVLLLPVHSGNTTNSDGYFELNFTKSGHYVLSVSRVGYTPIKRTIKLKVGTDYTQKFFLQKAIKKIEEVSIVGAGAEKRILNRVTVEPVSLKSATSVVSGKDMSRQGTVTLIDAMKYIPGALTETRGRKIKQFVSVRGQTYPYPTYSVDGIVQREFYETAFWLNTNTISEIKIDRSSSSLLKSLSPLTGVINVKTRQFNTPETDIYFKYGSLSTFETGIIHGASNEKINYTIGANIFGTNGPKERNGEERIGNFNGAFGWKINNRIKTSVKLFYVDGKRELTIPVYPAAKKLLTAKEHYKPLTTLLLASKTEFRSATKYSGELQINYLHKNPEYFIENTKTGDKNQYHELENEFTINQLNAWKMSETNVLRAGVLLNYWEAPDGKRYYHGNRADVYTWSGVLTNQQRLGKWLLDAGFRISQDYFNEWGGFAIEGSGGKFTKVKPITNEWQPPVWSALGGVTRTFEKMLSAHGNVSAGVISPRTGAITETGEQPENEKRTNLDLGLIKSFHNRVNITVSAFMVSRFNAIDYSGKTVELDNGDIVELYKNEDKRNYGIELDSHFSLTSWLQFFANATLMKGETKQKSEWEKDDELPLFIGNIGTMFTKSDFDFNAFLNYTGAYKNNRFVDKKYIQEYGKAPLGDFTNIDLTTGYKIGHSKNIRFYIEVKNLLNKKFQTVAGYPDYGTIVSGGVNLKL